MAFQYRIMQVKCPHCGDVFSRRKRGGIEKCRCDHTIVKWGFGKVSNQSFKDTLSQDLLVQKNNEWISFQRKSLELNFQEESIDKKQHLEYIEQQYGDRWKKPYPSFLINGTAESIADLIEKWIDKKFNEPDQLHINKFWEQYHLLEPYQIAPEYRDKWYISYQILQQSINEKRRMIRKRKRDAQKKKDINKALKISDKIIKYYKKQDYQKVSKKQIKDYLHRKKKQFPTYIQTEIYKDICQKLGIQIRKISKPHNKSKNGFIDYYGDFLVESDYLALKDLENLIERGISKKSKIEDHTFGYHSLKGRVVGLGLSRQNLPRLPNSLCLLTSLEILKANENYISELPEDFGNLNSLRELHLRINSLQSIPNSIGNLQTLEYLDIFDNKISTIPDTFKSLRALQYVNLSYNNIHSIPEIFKNLTSLKEMRIGSNLIESIPSWFKQMEGIKKCMGNNPRN